MNHWLVAPIVLPLMAGAVLVLVERRHARLARVIGLLATAALLAIAAMLLGDASTGSIQAYLLGNWKAPFGIALVLDRLSALMLLLTALVALAALVYAQGGDAQRGVHFGSMFQFQLMGLNGAFLTADLFNLFVFFEVLLAASYGLLLHGGGAPRLRAALHYVSFNLAGSALFLVAVSLLYGLTGTLNMADLAERVARLPAGDAAFAQAAGLLLLVVFCVKAALLPLYFWLPATYASASAPVAALFAIMTKVGVYAIARVYTLVFGAGGGVAAHVAWPWLPALALGTIVLAVVGVLAARRLRVLIAYLVVASAGTLLLSLGLNTPGTVSAGLFYLVNSTLTAAAWFLLADRLLCMRSGSDAIEPAPFTAQWPLLGAQYFVFAVAIAGVPPLAGFLGKSLLIQAAGQTPWAATTIAVVLASSLAVLVALARAGSTVFWKPAAGVRATGIATTAAGEPWHRCALLLLLLLIAANTVGAGALSAYTQAAAAQLFERRAYIDAVLGLEPVPPAYDVRREIRERIAPKVTAP